jgi:cob(I)alamin adenosyltransferase
LFPARRRVVHDVSGSNIPPRWSNRQGFVHIYCGTGKGKTTAALGLSLRTLLTGGSVYFAQFFKGTRTAEEQLCTLCDRFVIDQLGTGRFITGHPQEVDIRAAQRGLEFCRDVLVSGYFNLVVLDEILHTISYGMVSGDEIIDLLTMRHPGVEVVLTGRRAPASLIRVADLVTDMSSVKHYFDQGIGARSGIEY